MNTKSKIVERLLEEKVITAEEAVVLLTPEYSIPYIYPDNYPAVLPPPYFDDFNNLHQWGYKTGDPICNQPEATC